ncbi:MAG: hypothetical protein L0221_07550 [Chloroflexi bacterium]|nr:hypothetical protein [Chloroflexota bacterium]
MRRQAPIQTSRPLSTVTPTVRMAGAEADDRAVLLDRAPDGAELEVGPIPTTRGAHWARTEGIVGLGLVAILFGGALINSIANPGPSPTPSGNALVLDTSAAPTPGGPRPPRPSVEPTPAVTPAVPCGAPAEGSGPPIVTIVVPSQDPIAGTIGVFKWFGSEAGPTRLTLAEGPSIPFEGDLELHIGGEYCATRWSIGSMQLGHSETALNESVLVGIAEWASFTANRADNPIIARQNRIAAKPVGLGRVAVRAILNFEGGHVVHVYWLLKIAAFEAPPIRVVGPDGTAVTPVVGCGVSISTNENWFGEECPPGSWPLLEDGPLLIVHEGDIVELESPDWPLVYWYVRWANQAAVQPGGFEPPDVGNMGGYDSLNRTLIRWFVPPAGDYTVLFSLTHEEPNRQYSLPLHVRVRVLP